MRRRGFLLRALGVAGILLVGAIGRAGRWALDRFRIPRKRFDRSRLREPNDLRG